VHPDDLPHAIASVTKSLVTGEPYDIEHRCRRADGMYRWFQVRGLPVRDSDGDITGWYLLLTDIDDRKRAEDAIRASERSLDQIINAVPALAWSAHADGSAEFLNRYYLDYVGLSEEQMQGSGWTTPVHPDDLNGLAGAWQEMMDAGQPGECEARLCRFDGEYRWFLFRTNPLRDQAGHIVKWYGINIDIEDRKQAETALKRSEALLAEGQALSSTGTLSWRLDTDEMTFSEELKRIFELEPSAVVTHKQIFTRIHPEDAAMMRARFAQIRAGTASRDNEMRLLMPDGRVKYLRVITRDVLAGDGRLEQLGAIQDMTQRRLAEEALSKARAELAQVARITSLGVLTASIAHEVNQPLAAIITNGETSLRWLARPEPNFAKVDELTRRLVADARRAADIIDRIRGMATTHRTPSHIPQSLNTIVEESIAFLRHEFQAKGIAVSVDLAPDLPRIAVDRIQLQQVLVNIAANAIQATAQSDAASRNIRVRTLLSDPETVCCTIEDSGPGIKHDDLPQLFDTFFTTKESGMGMGLAISRSIIETHGGRIRVSNDSAFGGARFSFTLPANNTDQVSAGTAN
jgi:PAS domain S-box-containing protein